MAPLGLLVLAALALARPATIHGRAGPRPTWRSRWRSPALFSCRCRRMAGRPAPTRRTRPRPSRRSGILLAAHRFLKVAAEHDKRERSARRPHRHGHQRRPSHLQRTRQPDPPLRRDRRGAGVDGEGVRDHRRRRRQPRRQRGRDPAGGGRAWLPEGHLLPPQHRAVGGVRRRLPRSERRAGRHHGRRSPERSARHPASLRRQARRRVRPRHRLAQGPQGRLHPAARPVADRQPPSSAR